MSTQTVVIVSAQRTAIGTLGGGLSTVPAAELGSTVIKAALGKASVAADDVNEVVMGQVLTSANGQNPARQAALKAGLPDHSTALTINQVCGAGLRAVAWRLSPLNVVMLISLSQAGKKI